VNIFYNIRNAVRSSARGQPPTSKEQVTLNADKFKSDSEGNKKIRSAKLKAVDTALDRYNLGKSKQTLYALTTAILDWYASKQNWVNSVRKDAMIVLINYVKSEALVHAPSSGRRIFNHCQAKQARDEMLRAPASFLRKHRISIAGNSDGPKTFYMIVDSGDLIFEDQLLNPAPLGFPVAGYKLTSDAHCNYGAKMLNTMSIEMHQNSNPANAADVTNKLVPLQGQVVVTGMLTACTFVIRKQAGAVSATHLQPTGDGNVLQDLVAGWNIQGVTLYGKRNYTSSYTHVMGFGGGGNWQFYAQKGGPGTTIVGVDKIRI